MYERSAIVLERYFENLLRFNKPNNLKQNFKNYCDLFEKFNSFQQANSEEFDALAEFQSAEKSIEEIQNSEEKLYKKNAKLEYNRDLIFSDITQKPDEIEKCIIKIENDISKNQTTLISLREKFVEAIRIYNEKKSKLAKCKKNRKNSEKDYNSSFEVLKQALENMEEEYVEIAKSFATEENENNLICLMSENGKEEKIPFNNSVITNAAKLGMDILKREVECYVKAYEMSEKLRNELLEGAVSVELHEKVIKNIEVKLNFLNAEKDYLVQFLDYERITVIYGKRTHRTLMVEACEKFEIDIVQINNLYELLLKEIANKSTKKAYKELYNKSYLIDIEEKDAKFKKEKNKMNLPVGTIMNSNYWRIEGIKNIYTVFYKDVSEVFGKDLVEFDLPKEQEDVETANIEQVTIEQENVEKIKDIENGLVRNLEKEESKEKIDSELPEKINIEEPEHIEMFQNIKVSEINESAETVKTAESQNENLDKQSIEESIIVNSDEVIEKNDVKKKKKVKRYTRKRTLNSKTILDEKVSKDVQEENIAVFEESIMEDTLYEKDDMPFEEESIFNEFANMQYEELNFKKNIDSKKEKNKKVGFFNKIRKLNSKEKKQVNS